MISPIEIKEQCLKWFKEILISFILEKSFFPKEITKIGKVNTKDILANLNLYHDAIQELQKYSNENKKNSYKIIWEEKNFDKIGKQNIPEKIIFETLDAYLKYSDKEKEFYAGSSGKSGGQKEKLAYTILASALAYQFGLEYGESKSKSFRFVVIDEAFGRGDDESTQFGLGLFKKLNLQLLIVTPLQKIHIIENYINSVHYVSNTNGNNSELQNLTVEEYKQEKIQHNLSKISVEEKDF